MPAIYKGTYTIYILVDLLGTGVVQEGGWSNTADYLCLLYKAATLGLAEQVEEIFLEKMFVYRWGSLWLQWMWMLDKVINVETTILSRIDYYLLIPPI